MRRGTGAMAAGLTLIPAVLAGTPAPSWSGELAAVTTEVRPALSLRDLEGRQWGLGDLRGNVVLVNFWASWCTPCIEEMPSIQRLAETLLDRPFAVISVNVAEGRGRAEAAARQMGIAFPVLLDEDSAMFERWGANVLPSTYLLDKEGVVRFLGRGPLDWDGVETTALIEGLLASGTKGGP